jgi:hypothetical protein
VAEEELDYDFVFGQVDGVGVAVLVRERSVSGWIGFGSWMTSGLAITWWASSMASRKTDDAELMMCLLTLNDLVGHLMVKSDQCWSEKGLGCC